jgi:hypothetical protein
MDQSQQHVEADDEVDCGGGGAVAWPEATVKGMTPAQRYANKENREKKIRKKKDREKRGPVERGRSKKKRLMKI